MAFSFRAKQLIRTLFSGKMAIVTNTVSGTILFVVGDAVEQKAEIQRNLHKQIDYARIGKNLVVKLCYFVFLQLNGNKCVQFQFEITLEIETNS